MCTAAHASVLPDSRHTQKQKRLSEITSTIPACHLPKVGCVSFLLHGVMEVKEEGRERDEGRERC